MGKLRKHWQTMRNTLISILFAITLLHPTIVEGIFLGPVAVGAVLGAIAVKSGFFLGALLSQRRTRTQRSYSSGGGYTYKYQDYNGYNHYNQQPAYYQHYTKPKTYYYTSTKHNYYGRGKRFAPEVDIAELERFKKEVSEKLLTDEWYLEMVEKDQDDCTKRLICEVSHKKAQGQRLSPTEEGVMEIFGQGSSVDTSKTTAIFDFAAQAGKYWKTGGIGCDFYRRCDTPIDDILAMIEAELDDFEKLEESMQGSKDKMEGDMVEEKNSVEKELRTIDPDVNLI